MRITAAPTASARTIVLLVVLFLTGCAPTISPYSPTAYELATSLKVESLALMAKATEPYERHAAEVDALRLQLAKAHEFARGRPRNEESTRQWAILLDPERNLLGGFLARWQESSTLSPAFVEQAQQLVADAFDTIIGLESGKIRRADAP